MMDHFRESTQTVHMLKKYLCAYSSGIHGGSHFRDRINRSADLDRMLEDARSFFGGVT